MRKVFPKNLVSSSVVSVTSPNTRKIQSAECMPGTGLDSRHTMVNMTQFLSPWNSLSSDGHR